MEWTYSNNTRKSFKFSHGLLPLMVTLVLAGCDGGSGSTQQSRTLSFTNNDNAKLLINEQYPNPASTVGDGIIQYASDDENIAKVDSQGKVTALKLGQTKVRARVASNGNFKAADASYTVDVNGVNFNAWVGTDSTEIQLPKGTAGIDFYTSSDPNCDYDSSAKCSDLVTDLADGALVTDKGATTLEHPGFYQVRYGKRQAEGAISTTRFSPRALHQAVFFKNRFWVIGGQDGSPDDEVWSSNDGLNWFEVKPDDSSPKFTPREGHQVVVFDAGDGQGEQLWVLGGEVDDDLTNEVWSSTDGRSWIPHHLNSDTLFTKRERHQAVVFNGALWILGGAGNNDVWSSSDGVVWNKKDDSNFPGRERHQVVEFDNRLWLIDGHDHLGDVWMSEDGETWTDVTEETGAGELPARSEHQVVVFDNTLWLLGGFDGSDRLNDVWAMHKTGEDDYGWEDVTNDSNFDEVAPTGIVNFQTLVADGQLWLIGGNKGFRSNEIWTSPDGLNWSQASNQPKFRARRHHQVVVFDDDPSDDQPARLWLIGGNDGERSNDVWSSGDGLRWSKHESDQRFPPRAFHQAAVFDGRIWLVGGEDVNGNLVDDIWASEDGINWFEQGHTIAPGSDFVPGTFLHQLTVFDDKLWLTGGYSKNLVSIDSAWTLDSHDATWQEHTASGLPSFSYASVFKNRLWLISMFPNGAVFSLGKGGQAADWREEGNSNLAFNEARIESQVVAVEGDADTSALWLIGGTDNNFQSRYNDLWRSSDGVVWQRVVDQAEFSARSAHQVVNFDDGSGPQLWLIGGIDGALQNDVWRSSDGEHWRQGTKGRFSLADTDD